MTPNLSLSAQWLSVHGLIVVVGLLIYVLTTHSLQQRHAPAAAISWVLTIALIPYIGIPLYLLFGTRKLVHSASQGPVTALASDLDADQAWPRQLAAAMGQAPVVPYESLRLHVDGQQALQSLLELIDSAEHELVLCTFIIGRDPMGKALTTHLVNKARTGVKVRVLLDGFGRYMGGRPSLRALKSAGVQIVLFGPLFDLRIKSRTNLRNHRKMVVADWARLWCGGRNFAAEYFEGSHHRAPWRDLSFDLAGPLAAQAQSLFERDWAAATGAPPPVPRDTAGPAREPFAQVIASGPDQADDTVYNLLVTACFKARKRILAVTPYFVPDHTLLMGLSLAARRGVAVDIILPRRSNHAMTDYVRHRALREIAGAGARVSLVPYMLHAKAIVVDDCLAMSGSANLDARSLFLNYELMVAFYAAADIQRFASIMEDHRKAAARYVPTRPGLMRDLTEGLLLWLAFQL